LYYSFFDPLKLEKQNKQEEEKLDTTRKSEPAKKTEKLTIRRKKLLTNEKQRGELCGEEKFKEK